MPSNPDERSLFDCQMCGDCCRGFGGTYVTEADIKRIAAHIGSEPATVRTRFCTPSGRRQVLAQGPDGFCVFWDQLCTIHPVKPRMCRRWPYIPSVLADPVNWKIMAGSCPGIRADAPVSAVQETIDRKLKEEAGEDDVDPEPGHGRP